MIAQVRSLVDRCAQCTASHLTTHRRAYTEGSVVSCLMVTIDAAADAGLMPGSLGWAVPMVVVMTRIFND